MSLYFKLNVNSKIKFRTFSTVPGSSADAASNVNIVAETVKKKRYRFPSVHKSYRRYTELHVTLMTYWLKFIHLFINLKSSSHVSCCCRTTNRSQIFPLLWFDLYVSRYEKAPTCPNQTPAHTRSPFSRSLPPFAPIKQPRAQYAYTHEQHTDDDELKILYENNILFFRFASTLELGHHQCHWIIHFPQYD